MTGIAQDLDAALELATEAIQRLQEKDSTHELLKYSQMQRGDTLFQEFVKRFGKEGVSEEDLTPEAEAYMLTQYFVALRTALGENTLSNNPLTEVPSIHPFGTVYDCDLPPTYAHNVEAAKRIGLRYDPEKEMFVDVYGRFVRDKFFQPL